jgi:hypothetical protein
MDLFGRDFAERVEQNDRSKVENWAPPRRLRWPLARQRGI